MRSPGCCCSCRSSLRALLWAAALIYSWAIWTYTLLPLPDPDNLVCRGTNVVPGQFVFDVLEAYREAPVCGRC